MSALERRSESTFWSGVLTIFGSQLAVKLLGLTYRLVITNIDGFGDLGNGYYNAGFQVYTLLLALSSVGIPSAISKLVAQAEAAGNHRRSQEIFRTAMVLFFGIGLLCAGLLYLGADFLARFVIGMDGGQGTLRALSPAVLFVCLSSVLRGYYLGLGSAKAAGSSQVIEQLLKSGFTVAIVLALTGFSAQTMSAGANFATSIAAGGSFACLAFYHIRQNSRRPGAHGRQPRRTFRNLSKTILRLSLPVSAASIIASVGRVIDTATLSRGIAAAFAGGIPGQSGVPDPLALSQEAVRLMGMLAKGDAILNLPLALNTAFMTMLVPSAAGLLASGRRKTATGRLEASMRMTVLFIFPCAAGLMALARPIYRLIYPNAPQGWELLQISAVGMILIALNQTVTGGLQGFGQVSAPAKALFWGVTVKLALNLLLVRIPAVNIYGAPVASAACYLTAFCLGYHRLRHIAPLRRTRTGFVWRTGLCAGIMGVAARLGYPALYALLHSNGLALLTTIAGSAVLYFALLLVVQVLPTVWFKFR